MKPNGCWYALIFNGLKAQMMNKELDFIEWARNSGHGKTQVPMNLLEMILDYQKHVETKFKNLDIQRVMPRILHFLDENDQKVDIDTEGINTDITTDGKVVFFKGSGNGDDEELIPVYGA